MNVELIGKTENAVRLAASCAWTCVHEDTRSPESFSYGEAGRLVQRVVGYGHESVIEHVSFTLRITGLADYIDKQLIRHRVASFSERSQRHVKVSDDGWYRVPPKIAADTAARALFAQGRALDRAEYDSYIDAGIPAEEARACLAKASLTNIDVTMNARQWRHYLGERLCRNAQPEHRELAKLILAVLRDAALPLFEDAGPKCVYSGICRDRNGCGFRPKKQEVEQLRASIEEHVARDRVKVLRGVRGYRRWLAG